MGTFGVHRGDEAIPLAWNRFDESRIVRVVIDCGAQLFQNYVQGSIEIHVGALRPQPQPQFVSADDGPRPLQKRDEHTKGLIVNFYAHTCAGYRAA